MGFVTIIDKDGVEHTIHASQLPVLNQQCAVTYSCTECDKLRAKLATAETEREALRKDAERLDAPKKRQCSKGDACQGSEKQYADENRFTCEKCNLNYRVFDDAIGAVPDVKTLPTEWQPMACAPKDGTPVLLLVEGDDANLMEDAPVGRTIGMYGVNGGADVDPTWSFPGWNWCSDEFEDGRGAPTSWMPLPAPPSPDSGS
jgi:hypothetical protein